MTKVGKAAVAVGADRRLSDLLYREVIQAVLLFGLDPWVVSDEMMKAVEGNHVGFLRNITGKQARRQTDGS